MGRDDEKKTWVERNSGVIVAILGVVAGLIGLATAMANHKESPPSSPSQLQGPASTPAPVDVSRSTQAEAQPSQPAVTQSVTEPAASQPVTQPASTRQAPAGKCSLPGNWQMLEFMPGAREGASGIPYAMSFTGDAIVLEIDNVPPQYRPLKIPCMVAADGIALGRNPDPNIATMTQLLFPDRYEKQSDGTYRGEKNGSTFVLVRTE